MRKRLAIGAMAVAAVAVAGCSSSGGSHTSAASTPSAAGSAQATTGPATGTAACDAINHDLNSIMGDAAKAKATGTLTVQEARQAQLASNLKKNARVFIDDQSESGITPTLRQAEKTIAGTVDSYYANYHKPDSGTYGMKIINALGQVKQECGTAPWQTAI
jgi:outer membrane receptor protein involved in Fe transport